MTVVMNFSLRILTCWTLLFLSASASAPAFAGGEGRSLFARILGSRPPSRAKALLTQGSIASHVVVVDDFFDDSKNSHGELVSRVLEMPLTRHEKGQVPHFLHANGADRVHGLIGELDEESLEQGVLGGSARPPLNFTPETYGELFVPVLERACKSLVFEPTTTLSERQWEVLRAVFKRDCTVTSLELAEEWLEVLFQIIPFRTALLVGVFELGLESIPEDTQVIVLTAHFNGPEAAWVFADFARRHPEMVFVVSAGNGGENLDEAPNQFLSLIQDFPHVLVVAATNEKVGHPEGHLARLAHYSSRGGPVHLAAPGRMFFNWGWNEGTSLSAPAVARVLGLMSQVAPGASAQDKVEALKRSVLVPDCPLIRAGTRWAGVLNLPGALEESQAKLKQ